MEYNKRFTIILRFMYRDHNMRDNFAQSMLYIFLPFSIFIRKLLYFIRRERERGHDTYICRYKPGQFFLKFECRNKLMR